MMVDSPDFFATIAAAAQAHGARDALVDEYRTVSFAELSALIEDYAAHLRASGIERGMTVAIDVRAQIPHLLVCLALARIGAHQVTFGTQDPDAYRADLMQRLGVAHIVMWREEAAPDLDPQNLRVATPEAKAHPRDGAPLIFLTTSGTTRGPRIIALTEQQFIEQAKRYDLFTAHRMLMLATVDYNVAKRFRLYSLLRGAPGVFLNSDAGSWGELAAFVDRRGVTLLHMSNYRAGSYLRRPTRKLSARTAILIGGARTPATLRTAVQAHLADRLYVGYGTTEAGTISFAYPGEHDEREPIGKPLPNVQVEIAGADGGSLPAGAIGEIRIKTEGMAQHYHDNPEETALRFRDGWFYSGDVGSLSADGQLTIHGRKDDMMMLNSINIFPAEIERALESHPAVAAAAAFAIASPAHGEIPAVAIELKPGTDVSGRSLQDYSREKLGVRYPREVIVMKRMPRNAQGKVLTREIARLYSTAGARKETPA